MPTLDHLIEQMHKMVPEIATASGLEQKHVEAIIDGRWTSSTASGWLASAEARVRVAFSVIVHRECGIPTSRVEA
jgi:hypothetical protein